MYCNYCDGSFVPSIESGCFINGIDSSKLAILFGESLWPICNSA
uniref:Uncharacterized protein n=1 Tax=Rhizophora mucronata TaxID=61149 RepID=A0A2P2J0Y8_RHIMU